MSRLELLVLRWSLRIAVVAAYVWFQLEVNRGMLILFGLSP